MTDLLTVKLSPSLDVPATHAVLAGLPKSVRAVAGDADLVALEASSKDWPAELRHVLDSGARGVLLSDVRGVAATGVHDLAAEVPVVVDTPWALDPTVVEHRERIARAAVGAAVVDLLSVVPGDLGRHGLDLLLDQLALIRVAVGPVDELRLANFDVGGFNAVARAGAVPVYLSTVSSNFGTSRTRLSVRAPGEEWRLEFADPAYARPTLAYRISDTGEELQPTLYETAHRAAWRELHAAVTSGAHPTYSLPELVADLELVWNV
ncbi:hypothetical protein [Flindersiella endophytica]